MSYKSITLITKSTVCIKNLIPFPPEIYFILYSVFTFIIINTDTMSTQSLTVFHRGTSYMTNTIALILNHVLLKTNFSSVLEVNNTVISSITWI